MSDAPELLPCPFCGEVPEVKDFTDKPACAWVMIHRCKAIGPIKLEAFSGEFIANSWNRRAPDPRVAALVEALHPLLRFAENTESELGIVLDSADLARAALAALDAKP